MRRLKKRFLKYFQSFSVIAKYKKQIDIIDKNKSGKKGPVSKARGIRHRSML